MNTVLPNEPAPLHAQLNQCRNVTKLDVRLLALFGSTLLTEPLPINCASWHNLLLLCVYKSFTAPVPPSSRTFFPHYIAATPKQKTPYQIRAEIVVGMTTTSKPINRSPKCVTFSFSAADKWSLLACLLRIQCGGAKREHVVLFFLRARISTCPSLYRDE